MTTQTDNASDPQKSNGHAGDELRLLYQDSLDNIRMYKRQQWSVTNYGLLLNVGLIGICELLNGGASSSVAPLDKALLGALAVVVFFVGVYFLHKFQQSLVGCRKTIERVRKHFTKEFNDAWEDQGKTEHTSYFHSFDIVLALSSVILLSSSAVWWVLYW